MSSILSESLELGAQDGDFILGAALDEGVLKGVPILSSALSLVRLGRTITDRIFFAKVKRMTIQLATIDSQKREEFRDKMRKDSNYSKKVGECLVLICDSLDSMAKAEMLGVAFRAHIEGAINLDAFRRIATAIKSGYVDDLVDFARSGNEPTGLVREYMFRLTHTGLTSQDARLHEGAFNTIVDNTCELTNLGREFLKAVGSHYEEQKSSRAGRP